MTSQPNDYKELPCRRCGRVWKWAFDKKSEPCCPEGYGCAVEEPSIKELFDEVIRRLDVIDMKIRSITPVYPVTPVAPSLSTTICGKCGMKWEGVMGYSCHLQDCPVQLKVTSQTYNISSVTGSFNIESLDPDQRTWYYDGDGTKRKKDES